MAFHESEVCQCWEEKRYLHTDTNCSPIPLKGGAWRPLRLSALPALRSARER